MRICIRMQIAYPVPHDDKCVTNRVVITTDSYQLDESGTCVLAARERKSINSSFPFGLSCLQLISLSC